MDKHDHTHEGRRTCLYEQVAFSIRHLIEGGTLRSGDRIPSLRQMSRQQKVSLTTVMQAYNLLEDKGLIEARPQSGFYVSNQLPTALPEPETSSPESEPTNVTVNEVAIMLQRDSHNPKLYQFGAALPHPDLLPTHKLNRMLIQVARHQGAESGLYDVPPGCEALRVQIARRAIHAGCQLTPADIVTTSGCTEAIGLCLRAICRPRVGDKGGE